MAHLFITNLLLDPIKKILKSAIEKIFSKRIKNKIYNQLKFSQKKKISNKKYGKVIKERERIQKKKMEECKKHKKKRRAVEALKCQQLAALSSPYKFSF